MKKNNSVFLLCFLIFCLLVCAYGVLRIYIDSRTKLAVNVIVGQTTKNNDYSAERCIMSDRNKITDAQIFDSDYDTLLNDLREKYKQNLIVLREEFNQKLKQRAYDALGSEFSMLLSERVILLKDFEKITKKLLLEGGLSSNNEKLIALNNWAKEGDKKDKDLGKNLFRTVIDEIQKISPELSEKTLQAENALETNQKQLEECIERNSDKMKKTENETRAEMKKEIVKLILDYNNELKKLRGQFNVPHTKPESPFADENLSDKKSEKVVETQSKNTSYDVFEDDSFIPTKKDTDDIN